MNHRIKNLLTLSSGLVSLSARYAETPAELASAVQERLQALARAQEMILPDTAADAIGEANRGTTLRALIATVVSPFEDPLHKCALAHRDPRRRRGDLRPGGDRLCAAGA